LLERVPQLVRAIRRVDVHQHGSGLRGRVLGEHPLGAVRRPHADPITLRDPALEQAGREAVDGGVELGVRQPDALRPADQRVTVGMLLGRALEVGPDRLAEQGDVGSAVGVREGHAHV
jgi:hypothetical protein